MSKLLAYIGLGIAVIIWGMSFVSVDILLEYLTPLETNVLRFTFSSLILWMMVLLRNKRMGFLHKDIPVIMIAGAFGTAGYYFFENIGLLYLSPATVSIINGTIPIITIVIAMLFMGKKTKFRNLFLIGLSFAGIWVLSGGTSQGLDGQGKGLFLVMMGNLLWVLYTLFNERLNRAYDKLNLLAVQMTCGTVVIIAIYLMDLAMNPTKSSLDPALVMSTQVLGQMIFLTIFGTVLTYYLYNHAIEVIGVTISALFINVIPVVTLVLSVATMRESFSFDKIMGGLMVVIAVFFIEDL